MRVSSCPILFLTFTEKDKHTTKFYKVLISTVKVSSSEQIQSVFNQKAVEIR